MQGRELEIMGAGTSDRAINSVALALYTQFTFSDLLCVQNTCSTLSAGRLEEEEFVPVVEFQ